MAAREHQGMQIALIIFVGLTLFVSGAAFMFFSSLEEARTKIKTVEEDSATKVVAMRAAIDEATEYKKIIGAPQKATMAEVKTLYEKDMKDFGASVPASEQHYHKLVADMDTQFKAANDGKIAYESREQELQKKITDSEAAKVNEFKVYTTTIAKTAKDLAGEREKFVAARNELTKASTDLAKKMDDKRKELDELAKKSTEKIQDLGNQIANLGRINQQLTVRNEGDVESRELPDGKITWVNQKSRVVWVNLGSADALRRQTSFSVIDAAETTPDRGPGKANIEITRILDQHLAEARILDDNLSNPIMPEDKIFSPVWQAGHPESFALAGFMDINGDSNSDRKRIKDLIALNGGVIDAEVTDDGKKIGEITVNTRYLVLGDAPTDKKSSTIEGYSTLMSEAKTMGVQTMPLKQFLLHMGYEDNESAVPLGKNAVSSSFKPGVTDGNQNFKRRFPTPVPSDGTKRKSAF